jgi:hypothetical protein
LSGWHRRRLGADSRDDRPLAGPRLEPVADRRDGGDRLPVRGQLVALDRPRALAANRPARAERARALIRGAHAAAIASGPPADAQVFRRSARHGKSDLHPTGHGEVLSALLVILAVWLVGVPLVTVGLTALLMWRERESVLPPRSRYRIRRSSSGSRGRRRPAHGAPDAGRARSRHFPCRSVVTTPYPAPAARFTRGQTRGRATRGHDARSLCRQGRRRPLRGR